MELELSHEQRGILELIAMYSGRSLEHLLVEAALVVLERDAQQGARAPQNFLSDDELEARFLRLLRR